MTPERRKWCAVLAKMVNPDRPAEATEALIAILPMLNDLPDGMFESKDALAAVARHKRRTIVPALGDIRDALGEWWRTRPAAANALPAPESDWDEMDHAWLRYFRKREQEAFGAVGGHPASSRQHVLSLVRNQSPKAFQAIIGDRGYDFR